MPRKGRGHANETTASERAEILTPQQQSKRARTSSTPSPSPSPSQLSPDEKVAKRAAFAQAHLRARVLKSTDWKDEEKALRDEYGAFGYNFPKKCYDKLLSLGSLVARKSTGRPKVHSDEVVVYQIRQARRADLPGQKPHRLSSRKMASKLSVTGSDDSPTPSHSTICRIKKRLGFERIKRKKKPMVSSRSPQGPQTSTVSMPASFHIWRSGNKSTGRYHWTTFAILLNRPSPSSPTRRLLAFATRSERISRW